MYAVPCGRSYSGFVARDACGTGVTLAEAVIAASLAFLLGSCGDEATTIPAAAVSEASDIVGGGGPGALPLTPTDIERLATLANVERDVLESTASSLTESDVWTQSMDGVQTIYEEAPDGVRPTLVDVACSATTGSVYTEYQLHYAIYQRVSGFDEQEVDGLTDATLDLHQVMSEAGGSDRAEDRAAAALTCHTLEETRD
jgi:hypothetical protein